MGQVRPRRVNFLEPNMVTFTLHKRQVCELDGMIELTGWRELLDTQEQSIDKQLNLLLVYVGTYSA